MTSPSSPASTTATGDINELRAIRAELAAIHGELRLVLPKEYDNDTQLLEHIPTNLQEATLLERIRGLKEKQTALCASLGRDASDETANSDQRETAQRAEVTVRVTSRSRKRRRRSAQDDHASSAAVRSSVGASQDKEAPDTSIDFEAAFDLRDRGEFVETRRDELIRKGVLTPFAALAGFERKATAPLSMPTSYSSRLSSPVHKNLKSFERLGEKVQEANRRRPHTVLLDPSAAPRIRDFADRSADRNPRGGAYSAAARNLQKKALKSARRQALGLSKTRLADSPAQEKKHPAADEESGILEEGFGKDEFVGDYGRRNFIKDGEYVEFEGGLKVPESTYLRLLEYQRTGLKWLWELHCQRCGGIIGDEMGLGKTVQTAALLQALYCSEKLDGPILIICPATVITQWVTELRLWAPELISSVFHATLRADDKEDDDEEELDRIDCLEKEDSENTISDVHMNALKRVVNREARGVLISSYETLRRHKDDLCAIKWSYAILDEGHRIRNPDAEVTLVAKQLPTIHRLILTGAPIQNRLSELWSLFDFCFPGKLGTLPVFQAQFGVPIAIGGYANASKLQVQTAYKCALVLRDLIAPYLLRRLKKDVAKQLPKKTEKVLFCKLSDTQLSLYREYISSRECSQILEGSKNALVGIDALRKICNHPDLFSFDKDGSSTGAEQIPHDYGGIERSGKLLFAMRILREWQRHGHKALLFSQTQQMLDILEAHVGNEGWKYHRMDGSTPVTSRGSLINSFNNNSDVFLFMLTTRVGGLGINLVGANRVLMFDPDWNPASDAQARERAWRLGQTRKVVVYRLLCVGTIEEKIYQRQVYKHLLTQRVLQNPKQKRMFRNKDIADLFQLSLNDCDPLRTGMKKHLTDTGNMFEGQAPNEQHLSDTSADEEDRIDGEEGGCGESAMLRQLFDSSNESVVAAMDHDEVVGVAAGTHSSYASAREAARIEEEAKRVAREAADELQRSRRATSIGRRSNVAIPTWTGRSGGAGAPSFFGKDKKSTASAEIGKQISSSKILEKIRERKATVNAADQPNTLAVKDVMRKVAAFLRNRGGRATTAEIVNSFAEEIGVDPAFKAQFRQALKQVAKLEKSESTSQQENTHRPLLQQSQAHEYIAHWILREQFDGS